MQTPEPQREPQHDPGPGRQGQGHRARRPGRDARAGHQAGRPEDLRHGAQHRGDLQRREGRGRALPGHPDRRRGDRPLQPDQPARTPSSSGIEAEAGDELLFQIFYREEDAEEARVQDERYGDILKLKTYRRGFGRIAAQTAKQVIISARARCRARDRLQRVQGPQGRDRHRHRRAASSAATSSSTWARAEAVLPVREQVPRESYRAGDRVQAYVLDVLRESKGPQIILSRAHA